MPTIRLIPSSYSRSSTSRVTVTNPENMYYNTDHTANYCTLRGRNSSSYTYYAFIGGFNFDDVPSNATVSSFTVKIRCYRNSYQGTGSTYRLRLASSASNNSVISDTTMSSDIGTTVDTYTIPTGSLTWSTLSGYGSNFCIEVPLHATSSQYPYVYVYGAEIEVTYSLPTPYNITSSITGPGSISPSGTTQVYGGGSYTLTITEPNSPTVTDNNVNVTSQLVQVTSASQTFVPDNYTNSNFTVTNIQNVYQDATSTTSATLTLAGRTTGTIYLDIESIDLPSSATIQSVSCSLTYQFSRNNSSSGFTSSCQLYSNTTAKGSSYTLVSSATDVAKTTVNLTPGTWTVSELSGAKLYITATNSASSTQRMLYLYGVSFVVTYSIDDLVYTYTISNVSGNHTIVVTSTEYTSAIYIKENGSWVSYVKVYKKVNGEWVRQSDLTSVFSSSVNYLKG